MRKWLFGLLFAVLFTGSAGAVSAQSAIVLDALTGEALFEQNADEILTGCILSKKNIPSSKVRRCT